MQHFWEYSGLIFESERIPLQTTTYMKKALFLLLVLILGYSTSLHACEDIVFSIDFNGDAEIPETINYILEDNNGGETGVDRKSVV